MAFAPYPQTNYDPRTGMPRRRGPGGPGFVGSNLFPSDPGSRGPGGPGFVGGGPGFVGGGPGGGPGPINLPGFTPDYQSLIQQALAPLYAQLGAEGSADAASRNAALVRGLGQFGEQFDPTGAQAAFGQDFYRQAGIEGLLPQANALAAENTRGGLSVSARLKSALEKSMQQIQDALAARRMLRSGATGVALQGAQREFETGQYDARQSLTDYLSSAQQGFVAGERARQQQLLTAGREEAERQARLNPPTGTRTVYPGDPGYPEAPRGEPTYPAAPSPPPAPTPPPSGGAHIGPGGGGVDAGMQDYYDRLVAELRRRGVNLTGGDLY